MLRTGSARKRRSAVIGAACVPLVCAAAVGEPAHASGPLDSGVKLYAAGKYAAASAFFSAYADKHPRDKLANFYAAQSKAALKDAPGGMKYMSRVAAYSMPQSSDYNQAVSYFRTNYKQLNGVSPYSSLVNGMLVRWDTRKKPLRIFVSDGWQLPAGFGGGISDTAKIHALDNYVSQSAFYKSVTRCAGYEPDMRNCAIWGLNQWDWAKKEGLINYEVVTDPTKADVLVFWYPELPGKVGFTTYTVPGSKAVIEIQTKPIGPLDKNALRQLFVHTAAHEFGHAFGLQHSQATSDLMAPCGETITIYIGRGVGRLPKGLTNNDKATFRTLYSLPADYYLTQQK